MTAPLELIDHASRRLVVSLPRDYAAARSQYESVVPVIDYSRFSNLASWEAALEAAEINATHRFMIYNRWTSPPQWPGRRRSGKPSST